MSAHARALAARLRSDAGSTATEYALIASLIAVVVIAAVTLLGTSVFVLFDDAASSLP